MRRRITASAAVAIAALAVAGTAPAAAKPQPDTLYVSAAASGADTGARHDPFSTLAAVEDASSPGDRIIVLRASVPLAAGIVLKPRQRLIGAGPPVTKAAAGKRIAAIDGSAGGDGDSVMLANRTVVRNLRITAAARGGIYGRNISRGEGRSQRGLRPQPSCPGLPDPAVQRPADRPGRRHPDHRGAGERLGRDHGRRRRAADRGSSAQLGPRRRVRRRDRRPGDGDARVRATIRRTRSSGCRRAASSSRFSRSGCRAPTPPGWTRDASTATPRNATSATAAGADSEGVFINPAAPRGSTPTVSRNAYLNDDHLGGFSANGLEFVSMGDGATGRVEGRRHELLRDAR